MNVSVKIADEITPLVGVGNVSVNGPAAAIRPAALMSGVPGVAGLLRRYSKEIVSVVVKF